jgi:glycerophosphoryl diester phosphodiesterase
MSRKTKAPLMGCVDTSCVSRSRTGFPYLDAVLAHPGAVLALAHRGGAYHPELEGLENTLTAFRHAVALGYTYLETDVHASRDGHLLAFHDALLDRVTAHRGSVSELTAEEVCGAVVGGREQIPTMAGLLEEFPQSRFNIDLKSEAAVQPLADLIRSARAVPRVCVGSFSQRRIDRFRRLAGPEVATAAGPREVLALRLAPAAAVARLLRRHRFPVVQIPVRRSGITLLTRELIHRAHALGLHVHVWTVDEPGRMHALLDLGVDGLMTDRTDLLREVLLQRGQWMGASA